MNSTMEIFGKGIGELSLLIFLLFPSIIFSQEPGSTSDKIVIEIDLREEIGEMYPMWSYFGYDEPNYTYMKNGRKLISELDAASPVPVYYRVHNLLTTGNGEPGLKWGSTNAYTEDEQGNPIYDWTIVDKIFDTFIQNGGKPLVEIGFMPKALSSNPEPYRHNWTPEGSGDLITGWAYPPNDYEKWAELVYQWVLHSVERYGKAEVETWWWEPWNEPDIFYWPGTKEEYFKLYDYSVDAVKRALPTARVGGPTTTNPGLGSSNSGQFLRDFLNHCLNGTNYATGEKGSPLDYITFHAKGNPRIVDDGGHVQMDMGVQLKAIAAGFEIVNSFPEYKELPIIIGEADPEGCAACSVAHHPENAYRNGTMYSSYTASSFARMYELADQFGVNLEGVVSWSFEFEGQPWFSGFRSLATNGVEKPVFNIFRMFGMMNGNRVAVSTREGLTAKNVISQGVRGEKSDVNALATKNSNSAFVLVWNYHDDDVAAIAAAVSVNVKGIPAEEVLVEHYRIDDNHSNSYTVWQEMGAPQQMTRNQYAELERSGQLTLLTSPEWMKITDGEESINFLLPRQGVSLLKLSW